MNRKLILGSWGILGLIGLGSFGNCYHREIPVKELIPVVDNEINLERDAQMLNGKDYDVTAKDLARITRVMYFEGTGDRQINSVDDLKLSYTAIASVIRNREAFDRLNRTHKFTDDGLVGVVNRNIINKKGKKIYQFSCIPDNTEYFEDSNFENNALVTGSMGVQETETAYTTLIDVLTGEVEDPTNGALFYKTKEVSFRKKNPIQWHGQVAFYLGEDDCLIDHSVDRFSHKYYGIRDCSYVDYKNIPGD